MSSLACPTAGDSTCSLRFVLVHMKHTAYALRVQHQHLCFIASLTRTRLCQVARMPLEELLALFQGHHAETEGSGDVKYHLGMSKDVVYGGNKTVRCLWCDSCRVSWQQDCSCLWCDSLSCAHSLMHACV